VDCSGILKSAQSFYQEDKKALVADFSSKQDTLKAELKACLVGYAIANDSIDFSVKLVNEFSGELDFCRDEYNSTKPKITGLQNAFNECSKSNLSLAGQVESLKDDVQNEKENFRNCSIFGGRFLKRISTLEQTLSSKILTYYY